MGDLSRREIFGGSLLFFLSWEWGFYWLLSVRFQASWQAFPNQGLDGQNQKNAWDHHYFNWKIFLD